jgi:CheY-like chemotaxis protein
MIYDPPRKPWSEGPQEDASPESLLSLDDDALLHKIAMLDPEEETDNQLLEIVQSDRHFFIRQEAAKRIRNKKLLFAYEDDRHIGQVLVRRLTRREDLTYLERLVARSQHTEVRSAAQVQLTRLKKKIAHTSATEDATAHYPVPKEPWRVAVLHKDAALREVLSGALSAPEFKIRDLEPRKEAIHQVTSFDPHLVMADVEEVLGDAELHKSIRQQARYVPLVVLCPSDMTDSLVDVLDKGADEFLLFPVHADLIRAKVRALIHFAHRTSMKKERRTLFGSIGDDGVLPLLKLCEEQRLNCRLVVSEGKVRRWVDFLDGEMTEAGGEPVIPSDEALAAMLAVKSGRYEIADLRFDEQDSSDSVTPVGVSMKSASSRARSSVAPLASNGEQEIVDATLLGWAIHFIVEQAWTHLGTTVATGLLRRTHHELLGEHPVLQLFNVAENAQVSVDISHGARLPRGAVVAVALWMGSFLTAARRIVTETKSIQVREVTALMASALDQIGFYAAYDVAVSRFSRAHA